MHVCYPKDSNLTIQHKAVNYKHVLENNLQERASICWVICYFKWYNIDCIQFVLRDGAIIK